MNYIKQLEADNAELRAIIYKSREDLQELNIYLHSDKFINTDAEIKTGVNVKDVIDRIRPILCDLVL